MTPELSVVTTVYRSESYLNRFIDSCLESIEKLGIQSFELIFVLDGITDQSKELLVKRKAQTPEIVIVEFSRNFGHHYAITAGLEQSTGKDVFLIDCDLEVMPSLVERFYEEKHKTGADVVYGIQAQRKGSWVKAYLGSWFWKVFNFFSQTHVPENVMTERLMSQEYVRKLVSLGDRNLFLGGMMYWVGYHQVGIVVEKSSRKKSTYSFFHRLNLMFQAISSFSPKPLYFLFYLGLIISMLSLSFMTFLFVKKILFPETILSGFTTLAALLLFSTGVVILSLGIVGLYLSKIFTQTQNRPLYIIKTIIK
ncbi:glycosyltransferase family 2 protein [bacterium SCSIO 12741]|nr:glycosyltransferase family 2 protein [bacterium SCSIO 12741]